MPLVITMVSFQGWTELSNTTNNTGLFTFWINALHEALYEKKIEITKVEEHLLGLGFVQDKNIIWDIVKKQHFSIKLK